MKTMLSILALAGAATFLSLPAAEAALLGPVAKVEHLTTSLAEPVWWRRHYRRWGYYAYPAYGYYGCCYGGWGWRHHRRHWW